MAPTGLVTSNFTGAPMGSYRLGPVLADRTKGHFLQPLAQTQAKSSPRKQPGPLAQSTEVRTLLGLSQSCLPQTERDRLGQGGPKIASSGLVH